MKRLADEAISLAEALVAVPSQGGIDDPAAVVEAAAQWLADQQVPFAYVESPTGPLVGLKVTVDSGRPGPSICLDAPLDTAPVGSTTAWQTPPFELTERDGRLFGRGIADAKIAAAMFLVIAKYVSSAGLVKHGRLHVLLEGDEHTGEFGCIKTVTTDSESRFDFVAVGYPGNFGVIVGARGFFRAVVRVFGIESHSGSKKESWHQNAVLKACRLVGRLPDEPLPFEPDRSFEFGPKVTATAIQGGSGFSQIPGQTDINIDFRLTPSFDRKAAFSVLERLLAGLDIEMPTGRSSEIHELESWPAYYLGPSNPFAEVLRTEASVGFGRQLEWVVCGPSNVGNYLASQGIPATCGFGVSYGNIHAANEFIEVGTVVPVLSAYLRSISKWCLLPGRCAQ